MAWEPANLNEAVCYAKGWNDAVRAAAKIAEAPGFIECRDTDWDCGVNYTKQFIAKAIRELDRSMQAC